MHVVMDNLEEQLSRKREQASKLNREIREIENQIITKKWAGVNECLFGYYDIRDGKCEHGEVHHGNVYCRNSNCHK
jgi:hypothetical protein